MSDKELIRTLRKVHDADFTPGVYEHSIYGVAADRLEALLAENEHLREVTKMIPKWVSVEERLPVLTKKEIDLIEKFGIEFAPEYVVLIKGADKPTVLMFDGAKWVDDNGTWYRVSYWMPLPEPPSTEGGVSDGKIR